MRYTVSTEIAVPRERVVQLIADPANFPRWLRGLEVHEPISGTTGEVGTRSRVVFGSGRRRMEGIETVTRREPANLDDIPEGVVVHFERELVADGMRSVVRDRFTEAGPGRTLWESENEYRFSGVLMRVVGLVAPAAFRRQSRLHMEDFTAFAEHGTDVRDTE
jgi:carbon monoxide dehydrogenase subunit G